MFHSHFWMEEWQTTKSDYKQTVRVIRYFIVDIFTIRIAQCFEMHFMPSIVCQLFEEKYGNKTHTHTHTDRRFILILSIPLTQFYNFIHINPKLE